MSEGIDLITALIIQSNEINVETYYSKQDRKYGFVLSRMERSNYREVVTTIPLYPTRRRAKQGGNSFVESVRKLDLTPDKSKLRAIIGEEEAKAVSEIVSAVNPNP